MNCDQCGHVTRNECGRCSDCHHQHGPPQNENTQAGDNVYCYGHRLETALDGINLEDDIALPQDDVLDDSRVCVIL